MTNIVIADVTDTTLAGNGSFDVLMRAATAHLQSQFASNQIRGTDYANVYLGSMTTVLQQAIAFELGKQQAAKQAELIQTQIDKAALELIGLGLQNDILTTNLDKIAAEIALLEQRVKTEKAEILDNIDGVVVAGAIGKKNDLYDAQIAGYARDAEQKAAKIYTDMWNIAKSSGGVEVLDDTALGSTPVDGAVGFENLRLALDKLRAGVGIA